MSDLGATYAIGEAVPQSWSEAFKWFKAAADAKFTLAYVNLAGCYRDGDGVTKDEGKAVDWYRKAAEANEPRGIELMAELYLTGECGVSKDPATAAKWYKKGMSLGSYECVYQWGVCCATGRGVDRDFRQAAEAFRAAAEAGHPAAALDLGHCLMNGLGIPGGKKQTMAVKAYMQAAEAGIPEAMFHLGHAYANGLGVRRQGNAAAKWLTAASHAGNPTAMNELAQLYVTGTGVERDLNAAVEWYKKSANLGNPESAAALGSAYGAGVGPIKADLDESAKWFKLAAKNGMPEAEEAVRDIEKEKVIRAQRQKAVDQHEAAWEKFQVKTNSAQGTLHAEDVPVPMGDTLNALLETQDVKKVRARWGPDAFSAKYAEAFAPEELNKVLERLSQIMEVFTVGARMGKLGMSSGGPPKGRPRPGTSGSVGGSAGRTTLSKVPEAGPAQSVRSGAQPRTRPGTTVGVTRGPTNGGTPSYAGRPRAGSVGTGPKEGCAPLTSRGAGGVLHGRRAGTSGAGREGEVVAAAGSRHERSIPRPSEGGSGKSKKSTFDPAAYDPKSPYVTAVPRSSVGKSSV